MERKRTNLFLLVMVVLLLQVVLPVLETSSAEGNINGHTFIHNVNYSLFPPALMKEKEESENEVEHITVHLFELIDFSDHSSLLSEFHQDKITPFTFQDRIDFRPPLFALNRVFVI